MTTSLILSRKIVSVIRNRGHLSILPPREICFCCLSNYSGHPQRFLQVSELEYPLYAQRLSTPPDSGHALV